MQKKSLSSLKVVWQPHKYSRTKDNLEGFIECFDGVDELVILPVWSAGESKIELNLEEAFGRYNPVMADSIDGVDGAVKVIKDSQILKEFRDGLIVGFGAGDITYQIRGEI